MHCQVSVPLLLQEAWRAWEELSTCTANISNSLPAHKWTGPPEMVIQTKEGQDDCQAARMLKAREEEEMKKTFKAFSFQSPLRISNASPLTFEGLHFTVCLTYWANLWVGQVRAGSFHVSSVECAVGTQKSIK